MTITYGVTRPSTTSKGGSGSPTVRCWSTVRPFAQGRIVVAAGAARALADIPGVADIPVLARTIPLELPECPESLLVIRGGYFDCEQAQLLAHPRSRVTLVTRGRILLEADPQIAGVDYVRKVLRLSSIG